MAPTGHRASTAWTPEQDQTLREARARSMKWAPIQQAYFPGKTANACRKRHERLMERQEAEDWDGPKFEHLAKEYLNVRKDMWTMLADRVGEKWQVVEAKCWEKGLKNIQSAGRSATRRDHLTLDLDTSALNSMYAHGQNTTGQLSLPSGLESHGGYEVTDDSAVSGVGTDSSLEAVTRYYTGHSTRGGN